MGDALINYGIAGAVIVITLAFLRFLKTERDLCRACRDQQITFVANHMEHNTRALEKVSAAVEKNTEILNVLNERMR